MLLALRSFQIQGKLEAAERNFTRILSATPQHIHARIGLGYCAWLAGDLGRAAQAFDEAAALDPADEDAVTDCATALAQIGKHAAADAFLAQRPQTPRLLIARGTIAEQQGEDDRARGFYQAALDSEEKPGEAAFQRLITLHRRAGRFDAALAVAEGLAASDKQRGATAAQARGAIYLAIGRSDDAIDAFRAGLAADPDSETCALALAREWRRRGRHEDAAAVLADRPETVSLLLERSELALAMRDPDAARGHAQAADRLQPKRPEALVQLCRIEIDRGDYAAARAAADLIPGKGAEFKAVHLRALLDIARAREDDREAEAVLSQLVTLLPSDALMRVEHARALRKLGQGVAAAAEVMLALDWDPRSTAALGEAGERAQKDDDYETARHFFRRVLDIAPDHIFHHLRLVRLLQTMGSDEEMQALEACNARFGDVADLRSEAVRRLREAGNLEEALAAAAAATSAHPGSFALWVDYLDLSLRLRPVAEVERLLARIPAQNRREELVVLLHRARLAIRLNRRDEARLILEKGLLQDPHNRSYLNELFLLSLWRNDVEDATRHHLHLASLSLVERRMNGQTINASQSHNGQMINDLKLDAEAMEALHQSEHGTSRGRIRRLMELVRERPDHIPTAQALVVTAMEAGRFAPPPRDAAAAQVAHAHIPQRVAQYWDEDPPPADLRAISDSWRQINPGYEYRLYNDKTARAYLQERLPAGALQAYLRARDATTRADLFRLAVLVLDGGIWADMDDRCLKPVGQLFRPADLAVFWQERSGHICNNFMAAAPNHPILRRALVTAVTAINRGDHDKVWMLTGPGLITRSFAQEMAASGELWSSWLGQVNVIGEFDLWPVVGMHCAALYKRQGRHWHKEAFQQAKPRPGARAIADAGDLDGTPRSPTSAVASAPSDQPSLAAASASD
ncbi:tetratricopeptide repeat protein [Acidisoma cellulosilytica]|uniref:Tetratricopeptide repeat protein n=1 Tax=Acidisoma cellulosilyticum TaxID=2802395 RepID=A0A964E4V4_9PROT|nr:tetratricopeptide repeat protein [Acidisoma cellulosilyticum]MCB8881881.1 tetratricopeptide repeat protein [Acidisoma cellulosilyticum]